MSRCLPDSVKVYRPSSSFIHLQARLGLKVEVQVKPVMQVYLAPSAEHKGKLKGMCGNYNGQEADDFTSPQNIVEATGESFAASWNTAAAAAAVVVVPNLCRDKELSKRCDVSDHPIFKKCLKHVDFEPFKKNCEMDVCHSTSRSREKFCGALGSLARACGRRGVPVANWGSGVCEESCPAGQALGEAPSACSKTCHGFVEPAACDGDVPYSGCLCPEGQLLEPEGSCVPPEGCPCYAGNRVVPPGQSYESGSQRCVCKSGVLHCENPKQQQQEVCGKPQVYVNCSALPDGDLGKACERSCRSLSLPCVAVVCESGCTCAPGLVLDDGGFCVAPEDCPCLHNGRVYGKGESVNLDCNKCVCSGGAWSCTVQPCPGACKMYGDGHYVTFDGKRFVFDGKCDYGVVQDYCANQEGSFQIITDNEDCGTAGTTCSKSVRFFIKAYNVEVQMADGEVTVVPVGGDGVFPDVNSLSVHSVGLYRIVQAAIGVMVMWDRRTSIFVKLDSKYKGKVCGLCGNFNGDVRDDFTTRGGSSVASAIAFGNSWKSKESCSAVTDDAQPCASNHYRLAWAQRKCNILQSDIFQDCHSHVDRAPFFEACVRDSCACDSGGDCECFCTAVASYAQACNEAGICVKWRTPDRCPVFCDFFDQDEGDCTWHYSPCGNLPLTCKERAQAGAIPLPAMEGCFPHCPSESPYLDENTMRCVRKEECSCFFGDQEIPAGGEITLSETCQICTCENANLTCSEPAGCCYDGQLYDLGGVIANETDSVGVCTYLTLCTPGGHVDYNQYCIATSAPTSIILTTPMTRPRGESWDAPNCMVATCVGFGSVVNMVKRPCVVLPPPACVSGRKAVSVLNADGCCSHWECDCLCTGFGDPHMRTFDGAKFSVLDPCSYVLLQEKRKTYDLSISADFFDCDARNHVSCPRTLIIVYKGNELRVGLASEVDFALRKTKKAPFTDKGFQVTSVKTDDFVVIPDIRVKIQFNGLGFLIDVPRELFGDNTEGQCGMCNNNVGDDCAGRDGVARIAKCCLKTAQDWLISNGRSQCARPDLPPGTDCTPPPPPPPSDCKEAKICDTLILENLKSCKDDIDLSGYHEGCKFDHCVVNRTEIDCSSAQTAAAECGRVGKCVDWRSLSRGHCPFTCPGNMVYKPCEAKISKVCGFGSVVNSVKRPCVVLPPPTCVSGRKAVSVPDADSCCSHWECDCDINQGCRLVPNPLVSLYPPGEVLYNTTQRDGKCRVAICRPDCSGVGSSWRHPSDSCVQFSCAAHQGSAALVETVTSCAAFDLSSCKSPPTYDESGCCPVQCERNDTSRPKCDSFTTSESISVGSCVSEPVELGHCSGNCPSSTRFEMGGVVHECSCCRETVTEERSAVLLCDDGTSKQYSYTFVKACECQSGDAWCP
ncbi:unnamed protein product [Lampetra fluviatilis]